MNTILGWPFLISRNRVLDYSVIVAPDFLIQAGQEQYLRSWIGDQTSQYIAVSEVKHPRLGTLSIVFRKFEAVDENNNILKDEHGRPILWIDGLIFRESIQGFTVSEEQLDKGYSKLFEVYEKFWESDENIQAISSSPMEIKLSPGQFEYSINNPANKKSEWNSTVEVRKKRLQQLLDEQIEVQKNLRLGFIYILIGIPTLLILIGFYLLPKGIIIVIKNQQLLNDINIRLQNEQHG